jgi:hypothetical protein
MTGEKYYQSVTWDDGKMIPGEWKRCDATAAVCHAEHMNLDGSCCSSNSTAITTEMLQWGFTQARGFCPFVCTCTWLPHATSLPGQALLHSYFSSQV